MFSWLKRVLYFPLASYFAFFAKIKLTRWNPKIILITGSSGKTTLLHLVRSQLGDRAYYSLHANSSFGIPFNILGLKRHDFTLFEWPILFLKVPFMMFKKPPSQNLYIVEADTDRPFEGEFLAKLLKPDITLWISSDRTHSMSFDKLVDEKRFENVEDAIAYDYGFFTEYTKDLVIYNADNPRIVKEIERSKAQKEAISKSTQLQKYSVFKDRTEFVIDKKVYTLSYPLPEETFYGLAMSIALLNYLGEPIDESFSHFEPPAGRSSRFEGVKNITIIDSCYNANLGSMKTMLEFFEMYPAQKKWVVAGDMLEQGRGEQEEHERLAEVLSVMTLQKIILLGPRVSKYTYPKLKEQKNPIVAFENPKEVLDYIQGNIKGSETIFFKGARFMEGIIEHLLVNKEDIQKLSRREKIWEIRRKQWGL